MNQSQLEYTQIVVGHEKIFSLFPYGQCCVFKQFKMKRKGSGKIQTTKKRFVVHKYSVVLFDDEEESEKLFECIPDLWFVDDLRESCFFPPKTGKPYMQRAINCEKPDDDWGVYSCKIVSGGFCKCKNIRQ